MKRTTSLVLAAVLPFAALAQQAAPPPSTAVERAAPSRAEGGAADQGPGAAPRPGTYTVQPGDTLWDLSGRFLNNPWYWPKVWSYNPEIANPHWIEPGNVLRLLPLADQAPARAEPVPAGLVVAPGQEDEAVEAPRELEDFSRADLKAPVPLDEQDEVAVAGPHKIGYVAPRALMARRDAFVTPREVQASGTLTAAFEEKLLLSTLDRAYARFEGAAALVPGEAYLVYRTARAIRHPTSGELVGWQSKVLGTAKVVAVDGRTATVVIGQTIEPIERGDLLGPWTEKLYRPVTPRPNARDLSGVILAAQVDVLAMLGDLHVVFVDKGKVDGVEEGNVFRVVRSGDLHGLGLGAIPSDPSLPREVVGDLLVIDVKERVSTALVTRSVRELAVGDRVEMRAGAKAAGKDGSGGH